MVIIWGQGILCTIMLVFISNAAPNMLKAERALYNLILRQKVIRGNYSKVDLLLS